MFNQRSLKEKEEAFQKTFKRSFHPLDNVHRGRRFGGDDLELSADETGEF